MIKGQKALNELDPNIKTKLAFAKSRLDQVKGNTRVFFVWPQHLFSTFLFLNIFFYLKEIVQ